MLGRGKKENSIVPVSRDIHTILYTHKGKSKGKGDAKDDDIDVDNHNDNGKGKGKGKVKGKVKGKGWRKGNGWAQGKKVKGKKRASVKKWFCSEACRELFLVAIAEEQEEYGCCRCHEVCM